MSLLVYILPTWHMRLAKHTSLPSPLLSSPLPQEQELYCSNCRYGWYSAAGAIFSGHSTAASLWTHVRAEELGGAETVLLSRTSSHSSSVQAPNSNEIRNNTRRRIWRYRWGWDIYFFSSIFCIFVFTDSVFSGNY